MTGIFWPTLTGGIIIFVIMWWRIRDRVDPRKQGKIENLLLALVFIILLVDVGFAIERRADEGMGMNDCIAFYKYLPDFEFPEDAWRPKDFKFSFLKECENYFSEKEIQQLIDSGRAFQTKNFKLGLSSGLIQLNKSGGQNG